MRLAMGIQALPESALNIFNLAPLAMLHDLVQRMPPIVRLPSPIPRDLTRFNWLAASGTSVQCCNASIRPGFCGQHQPVCEVIFRNLPPAFPSDREVVSY